MEKKKNKRAFIERFQAWNSGQVDLTAMLPGDDAPAERRQRKGDASAWELKPIPSVEKQELHFFEKLYRVLAITLCLTMITVLLYTVSYLPRYGSVENPHNNEVSRRYIENGLEETGATNLVAGMILDYRAFDTLGESCVLFAAVSAVLILLRADNGSNEDESGDEALFDLSGDVILREAVKVLFPAILMFGIYVILNGHLSPGGGFSGGAIIGAGLILYSIAFGFHEIERFMNQRTFRIITVTALSFYALIKGYSFTMGANGLETGIPLGTPGAILSSGLILPLNIAVGLVVACTMYGFYSLFKRGRI